MKMSQWVIAAVALAALVFVMVFAGQYIGTSGPSGPVGPAPVAQAELYFPVKQGPQTGAHHNEEKSRGFQDYYFFNTRDKAVKVGLNRTSCRCSAVEVHVLPGDGVLWAAGHAAALLAAAPAGVVGVSFAERAMLADAAKKAEGHEMLSRVETAEVPAGAAGWVRLGFHSEKAGSNNLSAGLWFDGPDGKMATLETTVVTDEAFRVPPRLDASILTAEQLAKGVSFDLFVVSSTRTTLNLVAHAVNTGASPKADPFVVGTPERQGPAEVARVNAEYAKGGSTIGCVYRIPVTLNAVSADGTTPFEVGPFRRTIVIRCPDLPGSPEPKSVIVIGRVRGIVEIGNDDDSGLVSFGPFPKTRGKTANITLSSFAAGLELTFDRDKTAPFLTATVPAPELIADRTTWQVKVAVLANKASGQFPRSGDPQYEDAALYFKARVGKTTHSVRVGVLGTATE